jgi:hypothetical protein
MQLEESALSMPIEEARDKAKAYRDALMSRRPKLSAPELRAYSDALAVFDELSSGHKLIDVGQAIALGGYDEVGRPMLAIARADRRDVRFRWSARHEIEFNSHRYPGSGVESPQLALRFATWETQEQPRDASGWRLSREGWAMVPLVPPEVRPHTGRPRDWFILWEVEAWSLRREQADVDRDPALLRHVVDDVYAVIAEWDLTDVEMAVLRRPPEGSP